MVVNVRTQEMDRHERFKATSDYVKQTLPLVLLLYATGPLRV